MSTTYVVLTHAHSPCSMRAHANGRSFVRFIRAMRVMRALHCHQTGSDTRAAPGRASLVRFWSDALDHSIPGRKPGPVPGRKPGPESRALLANGGSGQGRPRFCACSRAHALVRTTELCVCAHTGFIYADARAPFARAAQEPCLSRSFRTAGRTRPAVFAVAANICLCRVAAVNARRSGLMPVFAAANLAGRTRPAPTPASSSFQVGGEYRPAFSLPAISLPARFRSADGENREKPRKMAENRKRSEMVKKSRLISGRRFRSADRKVAKIIEKWYKPPEKLQPISGRRRRRRPCPPPHPLPHRR